MNINTKTKITIKGMPNKLILSRVPETQLKTIEELQHQVYLLKRRLEHTETELIQARVSRDAWKKNCLEAREASKEKPPVDLGVSEKP